MNEQSEYDGKMKGTVSKLDESPGRDLSTDRGEDRKEVLRALIDAETLQFNASQRNVIFKLVMSVAWFLGLCIALLACAILVPILMEVYHFNASTLWAWPYIFLVLMIFVIMCLVFGIRDHGKEWEELQGKSKMLEELHRELVKLLTDD